MPAHREIEKAMGSRAVAIFPQPDKRTLVVGLVACIQYTEFILLERWTVRNVEHGSILLGKIVFAKLYGNGI